MIPGFSCSASSWLLSCLAPFAKHSLCVLISLQEEVTVMSVLACLGCCAVAFLVGVVIF
jgi:hypothetical protein